MIYPNVSKYKVQEEKHLVFKIKYQINAYINIFLKAIYRLFNSTSSIFLISQIIIEKRKQFLPIKQYSEMYFPSKAICFLLVRAFWFRRQLYFSYNIIFLCSNNYSNSYESEIRVMQWPNRIKSDKFYIE